MRITSTLLILATVVLGVWSFVIAPEHGWWFPEDISTFGHEIDSLFNIITGLVGVTFVLTTGVLTWEVWAFSAKRESKAQFTHGSHTLEKIWTAIPALILLYIAVAQLGTWTEIKRVSQFPDTVYSEESPIAEVWASQFDWRVMYPDEEGNFRGMNTVESPFELVVPVKTPVVFNLRSRDVLHSFFVPNLRLKQDAVPGMTIPVWFQAERTGEFDLICAELCGWGHYKMAGRLIVKTQEDYDAWLAAKRADLKDNGSEDTL